MSIPKIQYNFKGKNLTTDGGAITIENYLEKIQFQPKLQELFNQTPIKNKTGRKKQYTKSDQIAAQIKGYIIGYANPTEISRTKGDLTLEELTGKKTPSQATLSRLNTNFNQQDLINLQDLNKIMLTKYFQDLIRQNNGEKLEKIEIGDDSTKIVTYGQQEGSAYISHYSVTGYHPDLITEDNMRLIMAGILRDGNVYSSQGSNLLIKEVIDFLKQFTKKIIFRGDSAYSRPEIYNQLNREIKDLEIEYYIKAKTYWSWAEKAKIEVEYKGEKYHPLQLPKEYFEEKDKKGKKKLIPKYFFFYHQCKTWQKPEKIILKVIFKEDKNQLNLFQEGTKDIEMLIVKSNKEGKEAFKEYGKRGKQEQVIEEFKNDSFAKNLSGTKKIQNECVFYMKIIAHNLIQILRLETLKGTKYANCRTSTLRMLLVKIGGKLVKHARKIVIQLSETFAYKKWFEIVMEKINLIQFRLT